MLSPLTLAGRLVTLEPLGRDHVDGLVAAAAAERSTYGWTDVPDGRDQAVAYVDDIEAERRAGSQLGFAVRHHPSGRVAGATRLMDLAVLTPGAPGPDDDHPPTVAEVGGTWYAAWAQRSGVNAECKLLLLTQAFGTWGVARVTLKTDARNERSRGAMLRLGAQFEGIRRVHMPAMGTAHGYRDSAYYSIVADEWPAVRAGLLERLGR